MMTHILFADDNPDTRQLIKLIFNTRSPEIALSLAKDGLSAVEFIRAGVPVDLILLDYQMPPDGNGGIWAAEHIRKLLPDVPIFFLSAYTLERAEATARAAGAWGYICKDALIRHSIFDALLAGDWLAFQQLSLRGQKVWFFEENMPHLKTP